jgi:hypothetical protein
MVIFANEFTTIAKLAHLSAEYLPVSLNSPFILTRKTGASDGSESQLFACRVSISLTRAEGKVG